MIKMIDTESIRAIALEKKNLQEEEGRENAHHRKRRTRVTSLRRRMKRARLNPSSTVTTTTNLNHKNGPTNYLLKLSLLLLLSISLLSLNNCHRFAQAESPPTISATTTIKTTSNTNNNNNHDNNHLAISESVAKATSLAPAIINSTNLPSAPRATINGAILRRTERDEESFPAPDSHRPHNRDDEPIGPSARRNSDADEQQSDTSIPIRNVFAADIGSAASSSSSSSSNQDQRPSAPPLPPPPIVSDNQPAPDNRKQQQQQLLSQSTTSKRSANPSSAGSNVLPRVSESELLPLSDFNVHQPPFSELIKSWPPTSLRHLTTESPSSAINQHHYSSNRKQQQPATSATSTASKFTSFLWGSSSDSDDQSDASYRNHLNEDLDDSIVTADESFEQDQLDESSSGFVNFLGELGDFIYSQLRQYFMFEGSSLNQPSNDSIKQIKLDLIDELLDDFYYDQYENSQVLYYGPQLVREGDIFEIGCYMPNEQPAEWTKNGRPIEGQDLSITSRNNYKSPRVIRRRDFLGAKLNFSLKIFEASLSDKGNYRCNKMSRKFHKLVVVPLKMSTTQLYFVQQQLLSVVNPKLLSLPESTILSTMASYNSRRLSPNSPGLRVKSSFKNSKSKTSLNRPEQQIKNSIPGILIKENQIITLDCNISDELILRKLKENPQFRLTWFKNGKEIKGFYQPQSYSLASSSSPSERGVGGALVLPASKGGESASARQSTSTINRRNNNPLNLYQQQQQQQQQNGKPNSRFQFSQANGRQLQIYSAQLSDAGDYLCSWFKLSGSSFFSSSRLQQQQQQQQQQKSSQNEEEGASQTNANTDEEIPTDQSQQQPASNPLAAGNLFQLLAPVKLRPFKSSYHVRQGDELRLSCFAQRAYPTAQISWYIGNRLIDVDFLREHPNEFRILSLNNGPNSFSSLPSYSSFNSNRVASDGSNSNSESSTSSNEKLIKQIVEINPIPWSKQQMDLTANGRGTWLEYKDPGNVRYQIDTLEQQQRYLQLKLTQLTSSGSTLFLSTNNNNNFQQNDDHPNQPANGGQAAHQADSTGSLQKPLQHQQQQQQQQANQMASLSVLVINKLNMERHSSRYACRATTRANTDEVTTVIRVQGLLNTSTLPRSPGDFDINCQISLLIISSIKNKFINNMLIIPLTSIIITIATTSSFIKCDIPPDVRPPVSSTVTVRPSSGRATLLYGQPLNFQCEMVGHKHANFLWFKKNIGTNPFAKGDLIHPEDDGVEIHNNRFTLTSPGRDSIGDFVCMRQGESGAPIDDDYATIKVRATPHIEDFSFNNVRHTGKSYTLTDGERLELICNVRERSAPVNITWLKSQTSDDERTMVPITPTEIITSSSSPSGSNSNNSDPTISNLGPQTFLAPDQSAIIVETIDEFSKKLVIESVKLEHRSYYVCMVDNGVTERTKKIIFVRVKDKFIALWPFLGIVSEIFILFTIIHSWETFSTYQRVPTT